ncbi:MAG: DUF4423 domain-containing protein [Bdellovibrionota bacterium]
MRNSNYSLRAFARDLDINSGTLSQIFSETRIPSSELANSIFSKLDIKANVRRDCLEQLEKLRRNNRKNFEFLAIIDYDKFHLLKEWFYLPILEFIRIAEKPCTLYLLSKKLSIPFDEVKIAIDCLVTNGYLNKKTSDVIELNPDFLSASTVGSVITSPELKRFQKINLDLASKALDEIEIESRDNSTVTFSVNLKDIQLMKEEIKKFRRKMIKLFSKNKRPKERVYNMSIALFPVSEKLVD